MTEEQFKNLKIGDVVKLNSSNTKMTVTKIDELGISVIYFNDKGVIETKSQIPYAALTKTDS